MAENEASTPMEPWVREILRCPACRGELRDGDGAQPELVCASCGLAYPVRAGIPVLLVDEGRPTRTT